jgi:hypothetical protein
VLQQVELQVLSFQMALSRYAGAESIKEAFFLYLSNKAL